MVSLRLRTSWYLTLPLPITRRTVLQKVRGRTQRVLPLLVNIEFQVLFHSPPGVLFTFPSQYYTLSVTEEYLGLEGGPSGFPQGFSCLVVLWITACGAFVLSTGLSPCIAELPSSLRLQIYQSFTVSSTPDKSGLGSSAFARRYLRNRCFFLFLRLLRCFSSPGSLHYDYVFIIG